MSNLNDKEYVMKLCDRVLDAATISGSSVTRIRWDVENTFKDYVPHRDILYALELLVLVGAVQIKKSPSTGEAFAYSLMPWIPNLPNKKCLEYNQMVEHYRIRQMHCDARIQYLHNELNDSPIIPPEEVHRNATEMFGKSVCYPPDTLKKMHQEFVGEEEGKSALLNAEINEMQEAILYDKSAIEKLMERIQGIEDSTTVENAHHNSPYCGGVPGAL